MATLGPTQHAERALRLLMGMRLPRVQEALRPFGWGGEVLEEGWKRLSALSVEAAKARPRGRGPAELLGELEDFQRRWLSICSGVLSGRAPQVAHPLLAGLTQARGRGAIVSVGVFLERLGRLGEGGPPFAAEGPAARGLLRERGLTAEVEAYGHELVTKNQALIEPAAPELDSAREKIAIEALRLWYEEWSRISRTAVTDKTLLRALGLRQKRRAQGDELRQVQVRSDRRLTASSREFALRADDLQRS